jgi:hypothetical protein
VNLKTISLAATLALSPFGQVPARADAPLLPIIATTTTVPANGANGTSGDLNPYGVAFVPPKFSGGGLLPGDILVSNFNASSNLQGTGTTIIRYRPSDAVAGPGTAEVFFQEPTGQPPGLTLALSVLQRGAIVVGAVSTTDGTSNTITGGRCLSSTPLES